MHSAGKWAWALIVVLIGGENGVIFFGDQSHCVAMQLKQSRLGLSERYLNTLKCGDSASFSGKLWHEMSVLSIPCILRTFALEWKGAMWCITVPLIFFFHLRTSTLFALFRSLPLLVSIWFVKITPREKGETHRGERKMSVSPFSRGVIFTRTRVSLALLSRRKNRDYS